MNGGGLDDSAFIVLERWVMFRHLWLKFDINTPSLTPPKGGDWLASTPVLRVDDWARTGKPATLVNLPVVYGVCVCCTDEERIYYPL